MAYYMISRSYTHDPWRFNEIGNQAISLAILLNVPLQFFTWNLQGHKIVKDELMNSSWVCLTPSCLTYEINITTRVVLTWWTSQCRPTYFLCFETENFSESKTVTFSHLQNEPNSCLTRAFANLILQHGSARWYANRVYLPTRLIAAALGYNKNRSVLTNWFPWHVCNRTFTYSSHTLASNDNDKIARFNFVGIVFRLVLSISQYAFNRVYPSARPVYAFWHGI